VLGIFNVLTDVDGCDCTGGLCGHRKKESALEVDAGKKSPLPQRGIEPWSALRLFVCFCFCFFYPPLYPLSYPAQKKTLSATENPTDPQKH